MLIRKEPCNPSHPLPVPNSAAHRRVRPGPEAGAAHVPNRLHTLRILAECESAPGGGKGAVLRRERLYHSHIIDWQAAHDARALSGLTDGRSGP